MDGRQVVPEDLAEMAPGPELAAVLGSLELPRLTGADLVLVVKARARQVAHDQACLAAGLLELAHAPADDLSRSAEPSEFAVEEIAIELGWTARAAAHQLNVATNLFRRLPAAGAALAAGEIDVPRALVLIAGVANVDDDELARRIVADILPMASELTTGQLRARLARAVIAADPAAAKKRHERSVADRRVALEANDDGTASLYGLNLPPDRACAADARVHQLARAAKRGGDPRSMDQLRADMFLDLLEGRVPPTDGPAGAGGSSGRGSVELIVPIEVLLRWSEDPGQFAGYGPVIADIARQFAEQRPPETVWKFSIYEGPGRLVHHGTTRYRPTAAQQRFVTARDRTCRAPGCRRPAHRADLDHTKAHQSGGPTEVDNLGVLCRRHHRFKHETRWRLRHIMPGVFAWASPHGRVHLVPPEPP